MSRDLESLVGNKVYSRYESIVKATHEESYLIAKIDEYITNEKNRIDDKNIVALISLVDKYYTLFCGDFIFSNNIDKVLKGAKSTIYYVYAPEGYRVATKGEIENGVKELKKEVTYEFGEDKYKMLWLLHWTLTGKLGSYTQAGYKYNYINGELVDSIYAMILKAHDRLMELLQWGACKEVCQKEIDTLIAKGKANKAYKYPEYAVDELKEMKSVKVILYEGMKQLDSLSYFSKKQEMCNTAFKTLLRVKETGYKPKPFEITNIRLAIDYVDSNKKPEEVENNELRSICEKLMHARDNMEIDGGLFAFKIIETLKKHNYKFCSKKQMDILVSALDKINTKDEKADNLINEKADDIMDIANALGEGLFS